MKPTNERASSKVREVLECASPLALSEAWWVRKRQRTAALQDGSAQSIAPYNSQPFIGSEHDFRIAHWGHEPLACCAGFSLSCRVGQPKAWTTNGRFMERRMAASRLAKPKGRLPVVGVE